MAAAELPAEDFQIIIQNPFVVVGDQGAEYIADLLEANDFLATVQLDSKYISWFCLLSLFFSE